MTGQLPAAWLTDNADMLPRDGIALDVACGAGRHAVWLALAGFDTYAIDRNAIAIAALNEDAARRGLTLHAQVADLENDDVSLGVAQYDIVVVVHYLHRPLFPALHRSLRAGGVLVYETFTTAQAARGKPTNPDFLLREGELRELVVPLSVVRYREGEYEGRFVASVIARRG